MGGRCQGCTYESLRMSLKIVEIVDEGIYRERSLPIPPCPPPFACDRACVHPLQARTLERSGFASPVPGSSVLPLGQRGIDVRRWGECASVPGVCVTVV